MAAPWCYGMCPGCHAKTKHRYLHFETVDGGEEVLWVICVECFAVFAERDDGSLLRREATAEDRAAVPPPVVWSEEQRSWWQAALRQGQADLQAWLSAGCPGLTPELERALAPGTMDRIRGLTDQPGLSGLGDQAVPGTSLEG
jgi:hypothetical protein